MEYDDNLIRPYTPHELAELYGVSRPTLRRWLKPHLSVIGERNGNIYTSKQVKIIFECIGWPPAQWRDVA